MQAARTQPQAGHVLCDNVRGGALRVEVETAPPAGTDGVARPVYFGVLAPADWDEFGASLAGAAFPLGTTALTLRVFDRQGNNNTCPLPGRRKTNNQTNKRKQEEPQQFLPHKHVVLRSVEQSEV